jgi:hypothetical protein
MSVLPTSAATVLYVLLLLTSDEPRFHEYVYEVADGVQTPGLAVNVTPIFATWVAETPVAVGFGALKIPACTVTDFEFAATRSFVFRMKENPHTRRWPIRLLPLAVVGSSHVGPFDKTTEGFPLIHQCTCVVDGVTLHVRREPIRAVPEIDADEAVFVGDIT